jgi:hypothetical protein
MPPFHGFPPSLFYVSGNPLTEHHGEPVHPASGVAHQQVHKLRDILPLTLLPLVQESRSCRRARVLRQLQAPSIVL